jgi:uncharacterized protein
MDILKDFILSYYFLSFFIAWILACIFKTILTSLKEKKFSIFHGFANGGMPSTHTVAATSITSAIALTEGFTPLFFAALVFALIVISDAFGIRKNIGVQGEAINEVLEKLQKDPIKVIYGHSFFQVLVGIIWGIVVPVIMKSIMGI